MDNEHTQGPWEWNKGRPGFYDLEWLTGANGERVLTLYGNGQPTPNKRLIRAAPDLLEACEALIGNATDSYCEWCERHAPKNDAGYIEGPIPHREGCAYVQAVAAVAKARGDK